MHAGIVARLRIFADFTRIDHAVIVVLAILAAMTENIALQEIELGLGFLPFLLAPFFITLYSFAINDIRDYEADRENKRKDRPLASGTLSLESAKLLMHGIWIVTAVLLVACAWIAKGNPALLGAVVILWAFYMTSVLYSMYLKDLPLVGNAFIGLSMAIPFLYAGLLAEDFTMAQRLMFGAALLLGISREVMKSIQDMKGDSKARRSKSLPLLIGKEKSYWFAVWLLLTLLLMTLINVLIIVLFFKEVVVQGTWLTVNLGLVLLAGYSLKLILKNRELKPEGLERFRNSTKWLLAAAILIYLGSVVVFG